MKYVIRRLIAGVVLIPLVAVAYTALYAYLILIGGEPTSTIQEVFYNGLGMGVIVGLLFQFLHKLI